jgi:hypothetical protein
MRKLKFSYEKLLIFFGAIFCFGLIGHCIISCNSCKKEKKQEAVVEKAEIVLERVNSIDKEYMFANYGDYKWFESCIVLNSYLDEENDGTITGVSNVFQVIARDFDTKVVLIAHTADTTAIEAKEHAFWVEDQPLNYEDIKVTFKEAYEKINQVNFPKPHSKQVVLRKQLGPKACNPQYIFGNQKAQLYVDAVTGEVTDKNPAFPEE